MQIESCGAPDVQSTAGAAGLFQVMPFHFSDGEDPLEVETNAARGLAYLARAMQLADGRSDLALAGYNGGHGQIRRPPSVWPEETQRYVRWGSGILEDARAGVVPSPSLQASLDAGGAHLCERVVRGKPWQPLAEPDPWRIPFPSAGAAVGHSRPPLPTAASWA